MSDEASDTPDQTSPETCDVCIVGAGIAGLNALCVASTYLARDQRIILVDRRDRVGGMWVDTYDFVRLHQPHELFTAGDIGWTLDAPPSYLATKGEVLGHFEHCLQVIRERVRVDELFGHTLESDEEIDGAVRITCRSKDGRTVHITAKRLIKAYGFRVETNEPLAVSSSRVRSISPDHTDIRGVADDDAPVWVIGSGKTAMDTVHTLVTRRPGRQVNMVAGTGSYFLNRDKAFPSGADRWWRGVRPNAIIARCARRFDGTNEDDLVEWSRSLYGTSPIPEARHFLLGILSEAESATIAAGLHEVIMDHFVDAVDDGDSVDMVLRSGTTVPVAPGSWIVNCTGYLLTTETPYEPYVSASGAVVSIQPRSATFHVSSFAGYYLTHLLFGNKIRDTPLFEVDIQEVYRQAKTAVPFVMLTLSYRNIGVVADALPTSALTGCGLDFDRWYPLPRRLVGTLEFLATHRRDRVVQERALERVRERFGVRSGLLDHAATAG